MKVIIASHRRSGTHLAIDAILNNLPEFRGEYFNLDQLNRRHGSQLSLSELEEFIKGKKHALLKTHAHGNLGDFFDQNVFSFVKDIFKEGRLIYVYRDGRDVMVSLYKYISTFRREFESVDFSEFLKIENEFDKKTYDGSMNRVEYWNYHVSTWLDVAEEDNIFLVSFEDLRYNYEESLKEIAVFLNMGKPKKVVSAIRRKPNSLFEKVVEKIKEFGVKHSSISFNKGMAGNYKNFFDKESLDFFDKENQEVMIRLGYYEK